MEKKEIRLQIGGWKFVLQNEVARAAEFVEGVKDFVGEAVKVSPEASLAWAGVCLVVSILTKPADVEKANRSGFAYVTSRIHFYAELEPLLLPENTRKAVTDSDNVRKRFADSILELYQHILEFQLKSVCRFNQSRWKDLKEAYIGDGWTAMLDTIKTLEKRIKEDSELINTSESRRRLVRLDDIARQQRDIQSEILNLWEDKVYKLPAVLGAIYQGADGRCLADTRKKIRRQISLWADDEGAETVMWLSGPAGTGKSTISRTMAHSFGVSGRLVATYFFKRGDKERNDLLRLFPTIASQLMARIPTFRDQLIKSMKAKSLDGNSLKALPLDMQFEVLLFRPLAEMDVDQSATRRFIVVDALDECNRQTDIGQILSLFSKFETLESMSLHVFVTSRVTSRIERSESFNNFSRQDRAYRGLQMLDDKFSAESKADLQLYLKDAFSRIRENHKMKDTSWPSSEEMAQVLHYATTPTPLFIYAETLYLHLNISVGRVMTRLRDWLHVSSGEGPDSQDRRLYMMYKVVLEEVTFGTTDTQGSGLLEDEIRDTMKILGSVVLLATPLPKAALMELIGMKEEDYVLLDNLKAVLKIPDDEELPVEIIHKSFSDFLLREENEREDERARIFRVNAGEIHQILSSRCMERMVTKSEGLQKNICRLDNNGKSTDEISEVTLRVHIPTLLRYTCLSWVYHWEKSQGEVKDWDQAHQFLQHHFLHWLEVLSLIGRVSEGIGLIRKLQSMVNVSHLPISHANIR